MDQQKVEVDDRQHDRVDFILAARLVRGKASKKPPGLPASREEPRIDARRIPSFGRSCSNSST